ncbi:MAG: RNA methyltransferase [Candidatus Micrarchaeia archaeon]
MRFVLYEPIYDMNVGKVCRVMKNFGIEELYIVNPIAPLGFTAMKYAKHGADVLKKAHIVKSFKYAVRGRYPVIGTTGNIKKGRKRLVNLVQLSDIEKRRNYIDFSNAAVVFGREDTGLPVEVLGDCDFCINIETDEEYASLNLAVASGIIAYVLSRKKYSMNNIQEINTKTRVHALKYFGLLVDRVSKSLKNKDKCMRAFKNMLTRASDEEVNSIICVLKEITKKT